MESLGKRSLDILCRGRRQFSWPSRPVLDHRQSLRQGRRLVLEALEQRRLLACTVPITQTIRGVSVDFDQCYERAFNHAGNDYLIHTYYREGSTSHDLADNDDNNGDNINAVAMTDEAEAAFRFYVDRNLDFLPAGDTTLEVFIANDPRIGGIPTLSSINVDAGTIDNNDTLAKRLLTFHEMHHLVQCQYDSSWTSFYGEGIARSIEDRVDTALDVDTGHLFIPEVDGILSSDAKRAKDINTINYRSVLWWTWLMDQYRQGAGVDPPVAAGSDLGWQAIRDFYLELETQQTNELGALNDFITSLGGGFRDDFIDYTLAMYAFKYNPANPRLGFLDTQITATSPLSGHTVISGPAAFTTDSPDMDFRSSRYWEFNPADQGDYISFTFDGRGKPFGLSVMTVAGGNLQDRWTSYSDTFTRTVRSSDLDRAVGVVTAFDQSGIVDVGYGYVDPTVQIKDPTSAAFKMVGLADNPRTFLVRLDVDGQDGSPVAGLVQDEFAVTLNGVGGGPDITATIVSAAYVQEDYWLLVQAPDDAAGAQSGVFYDLTVELGDSSSDTQGGAVVYMERVQDVHIVLDHSGSMGGTTGKLEAAQNAANLLINELSDADQGGYVAFDTDADLRVSLAPLGSGTQRTDLEDAVAAETPASWTSIGDGLRTALDDYSDHHIESNLASFVLLSDGHENEPEYWGTVKDDIQDAGVVVHTVSFGPGANEVLLQEIATAVTGGHHYAPDSGTVPINSTLGWQNNLSRVYDNIATQMAGRQRIVTALPDSAAGGVSTGVVDFEDLPAAKTYQVGDTFVSSGVPISVEPLLLRGGTAAYNGTAWVHDDGDAGGVGQQMQLGSVNLDFGFARPIDSLLMQYGDSGGSYNLEINGEFVYFLDFDKISGTQIGGVDVSVVQVGDLIRFLVFQGQINSFAIGGQELWIDNVTFQGEDGNWHEILVDDTSDVLVASVAWQFESSHQTTLVDPEGNKVSRQYLRESSAGTNDVWEVPAPMPGTYRMQVQGLTQEYFVSASVRSHYELHPLIAAPQLATQGVEVPLVAAFVGTKGGIADAEVTAVVTDPANVRRTVTLYDDGNHGDGLVADGMYASVYTATSMADLTVPDPHDVVEGEEPQAVGSYIVTFVAVKDEIRREAEGSFVIDAGADSDGDGLPDLWEEAHGLNPKDRRDGSLDFDKDGLPNTCEYRLGTDPNNSDTDGGGESDGSEVPYSPQKPCTLGDQDPLDPSDDRVGSLTGVVLFPEATLSGHPYVRVVIGDALRGKVEAVDVWRRTHDADGNLLVDWTLIHQQFPGDEYVDEAVEPQLRYEYQIVPYVESQRTVSTIIDFEDLKLGTSLGVGQTIVTAGVPITGRTFFFSSGTAYNDGSATVDDSGRAGGSRQDMEIGNVNLDFGFAEPLTLLELRFGEYGGSLNLSVNGQLHNFGDFSDVHGSNLGGVDVVVGMLGRDKGRLLLSGTIHSFAIGGQELWIDNVIGYQGGVVLGGQAIVTSQVQLSVDPYPPSGYVLIEGGAVNTASPIVDLTLSADDIFGESDGQPNQVLLPGTPQPDLLMRLSNTPDFGRTPWQPFQTTVAGWDLRPLDSTPQGAVGRVYAQFRDAAGNLSRITADAIAVGATELAEVARRYVFYNNSAFDGNDPAANALDDNAIAPDKEALLPGDSASFANYTSYSRGINGIMIDVVDLPTRPVADDFLFRVGNDDDPAGWSLLRIEPTISVRAGAGTHGSDRVTIVLPDGAVRGQWLEVTTLPTTSTGLAAADVFYFGNAVGESGNSTRDAMVTSADEIGARRNPHLFDPAAIDDVYDFNRDRLVSSTDQILVRANITIFDALNLIRVPGAAAGASVALEPAGPQYQADDLAWLDALAVTATQGQTSGTSGQGQPGATAVDHLLADYWA